MMDGIFLGLRYEAAGHLGQGEKSQRCLGQR